MSAFVEVELTAEQVVNAMGQDGMFLHEVLSQITEAADAGLLRDNVYDLGMIGERHQVIYMATGLHTLLDALTSGHEMGGNDPIDPKEYGND